MSDKIEWLGGGIYSRVLERTVGGAALIKFYGRVWIPSQKRMRTFTLGTTPKQAQKKMREILGDPEAALVERNRKHVGVPTFGQVLEDFYASYRSRGGTDYHRHVLKVPARFFEAMQVTDVGAEALDTYLRRRRAQKTKGVPRKVNDVTVMVGAGRRKISESTLRKEVIALGTVFRWAERRGLVERNPIAVYERPKEPGERSIAVLSAEQEAALLELLPPLECDVVEWALYSGMRRGEVLRLSWRDVDRARGVLHVGRTKTGRARTVPLALSSRLAAILERHPRRTDTELVFREQDGMALDVDVLNGVLEAAAKGAEIPKEPGVMWNRFRHTWATRLAASGKASIFEIAKMMGNSAAICEKHYAAYVQDRQEKFAGALDGPAPTVDPTVDRQDSRETAAAASSIASY